MKKTFSCFLLGVVLCLFVQQAKSQKDCGINMSPMFGLTTEKIDNVEQLTKALDRIKVEGGCLPTLRVVFQPAEREPNDSDRDFERREKQTLKDYEDALKDIRGAAERPNHAYILGLLVDSYHFHQFNDARMRKRARDYATLLHKLVDVWETGNEVNGDWVGWRSGTYSRKTAKELENMRMSVAKRVRIVHEEISKVYQNMGKTPKFALNLYFNDDNIESETGFFKDGDITTKIQTENYGGNNCRPDSESLRNCDKECSHNYEMFTWSAKYLKPKENKLQFDYVLFSFYRDDCQIPTYPQLWTRIFEKLDKDFTVTIADKTYKPKVGFGEVAPQCYCSKDADGTPKDSDDKRRIDPCCRPEQAAYIREYYQTIHADIKAEILKLPANRQPDYVGGFFYWYFYQDATSNDEPSKNVLDALIEAARTWK